MAPEMSVAERLRAFVRERVRRNGAHFERGVAARLAEHLKKPSSWVTEYTDTPPIRHADLDTAKEICEFFDIDVGLLFADERSSSLTRTKRTGDAQAVARVLEGTRRRDRAVAREVRAAIARLARAAATLDEETATAAAGSSRGRRRHRKTG